MVISRKKHNQGVIARVLTFLLGGIIIAFSLGLEIGSLALASEFAIPGFLIGVSLCTYSLVGEWKWI